MNKFLVSLIFLWIFINPSYAFDPKEKTVSVVIPFAPGGGVDNSFKHLQQYAYEKGINFVPVFKGGAEGTIGIRGVADSDKNGYTLGLTTAGSLALYELRHQESNKVTPVTGIKTTVQVFVTHPNSGIKTFKDLENALKNRDDIDIGIGNPGQRIVWDQFFEISKIKNPPTLVPYRGAAHVLKDVIGGHIHATYLPITVLKGIVDSGDLIPLAVTAQAVSEWPNAPVISTLLKDWKDLEFGHVVFMPKNTDKEIVEFWTSFFKEYLNDPSTKKEFQKTYSIAVDFGPTPAIQAVTNIKPRLKEILVSEKDKYQR